MTNVEKASAAMGYDVEEEFINQAIEEFKDESLDEMKSNLAELEEEFELNGGRGIELADNIDKLRIAIACKE